MSMTSHGVAATLTESNATIGSSKREFVRHFFEMVAAMIVGMVVVGAIVSGVFAVLGHADLEHYAAIREFFMVTHMSVGMAVWMRYRGHSWERTGEMVGAMFVPFLVLLVPFWSGVVSGAVLLTGTHVLMLPSMLGAMLLRRVDYSRHNHHSPTTPRL